MGDGGSLMLSPDVTALPGTFSVSTSPKYFAVSALSDLPVPVTSYM